VKGFGGKGVSKAQVADVNQKTKGGRSIEGSQEKAHMGKGGKSISRKTRGGVPEKKTMKKLGKPLGKIHVTRVNGRRRTLEGKRELPVKRDIA